MIDRFATLYEIGRKLNSSLELGVVLDLVMDSLIAVTGAERGFIMLVEPNGELAVRVARNLDRRTLDAEALQISQTISRQVAETGQPVLLTDALTHGSFGRAESVAAFQLHSIMSAALRVHERPLGVVYVDNRLRTGSFSEADLELLVAFADQAAVAIDNARLYHDLRQQMRQVATLKDYQDNIFRSVASAVVTIDLEGRVTTLNHAAEQILGQPTEQAVGQLYTIALGDSLASRLFRPITRASRAGAEPVSGLELICPLPGRERAFLNLSVSALRDPDGRALGVVLVIDDQTDTRLAEEARERAEAAQRQIRDVFGRYVAHDVVERLLEDPSRIALGGDRQETTVLFADIRGYTTLSEGLDPETRVNLLNRYLGVATEAIFAQQGTLDKYIGDAVMALFNAPLPQPDHALAAARAALGMQRVVQRLAAESDVKVAYGIGVNTGPAVVGNIGTEQLMNYTAIGDAINVAARLQTSAPAGQVLLSESTYALIADRVEVERLEPLQVKGRHQPVGVYRLLEV